MVRTGIQERSRIKPVDPGNIHHHLNPNQRLIPTIILHRELNQHFSYLHESLFDASFNLDVI
jgi:hypothetical protein